MGLDLGSISLEDIARKKERLLKCRVMTVSQFINSGSNMPHTKTLIYYAEQEGLSEKERRQGLLQTLAELELVYRENKESLSEVNRKIIERNLGCAKGDVRRGEYWAAISDVCYVEAYFLQNFLPELPNLEQKTKSHVLLARKICKWNGWNFVEI